jgi:hypothetical protein
MAVCLQDVMWLNMIVAQQPRFGKLPRHNAFKSSSTEAGTISLRDSPECVLCAGLPDHAGR